MHSETAQIRQAQSSKKKFVARVAAPRPSAPRSSAGTRDVAVQHKQRTREEIRKLLEETESKLEAFGADIETAADKLLKRSEAKKDELVDQLNHSKEWLVQQIENLKGAEAKAEEVIDRARVKTHLAKMDVNEAAEDLGKRVDRIRSRIDGLVKRTSHRNGVLLKKLGDACINLSEKLM
jgi:hypothetical protein